MFRLLIPLLIHLLIRLLILLLIRLPIRLIIRLFIPLLIRLLILLIRLLIHHSHLRILVFTMMGMEIRIEMDQIHRPIQTCMRIQVRKTMAWKTMNMAVLVRPI